METACQEWPKARNPKGYGRLLRRGRGYLAHRYAWEQAHGPIPEGLCVLHRCDNPPCVNLDHLFLGTIADNTADMVAKGRDRFSQPGSNNPRSKLSEDDVRAIRSALGEGCRQREVAERFNISRGQVAKIAVGLAWAGVR